MTSIIYPISAVSYPNLSVQEGVQVFLTGGMALSQQMRVRKAKPPDAEDEPGAWGGETGR